MNGQCGWATVRPMNKTAQLLAFAIVAVSSIAIGAAAERRG
jgi:hypothetical protein